ncbi:unnamed protein product, partial [Amoebophrya sp. A25]
SSAAGAPASSYNQQMMTSTIKGHHQQQDFVSSNRTSKATSSKYSTGVGGKGHAGGASAAYS